MSARGITVSTVGLVPRMQQLATEGLPVTLALSLHAPDDELRDELVPINTRWNVDEVVDAAWEYARTTKRRVSIEYILIRDVNDQAVPGRPAGQGAAAARQLGLGARQPDPDEPDPGLQVDRVPAPGRERVRPPAARPRGSRSPYATPAAGRSTAPAASSPPTRLVFGPPRIELTSDSPRSAPKSVSARLVVQTERAIIDARGSESSSMAAS